MYHVHELDDSIVLRCRFSLVLIHSFNTTPIKIPVSIFFKYQQGDSKLILINKVTRRAKIILKMKNKVVLIGFQYLL